MFIISVFLWCMLCCVLWCTERVFLRVRNENVEFFSQRYGDACLCPRIGDVSS